MSDGSTVTDYSHFLATSCVSQLSKFRIFVVNTRVFFLSQKNVPKKLFEKRAVIYHLQANLSTFHEELLFFKL